ncbi:Sulfite exporter TauE/SafE [Chromobacterium violaceum]|uniref:Probable membrane transporter protein n=1 Tax=Chromobacterium violaceum TaxID=536 RepID=A0A447T441_CHRVL|nr:Sulfite exporter TauE/SafE [Chromobacterium violaceum]
MVRRGRQARAGDGALCRVRPETGRLAWTPASIAALAGVGALTGLLTGLLGVGGGFVIVPALRRLSDLGMHAIVSTSLLVIALVGGGSALAAYWHGAHPPVLPALAFVAAALAGMAAGRWLIRRLAQRQVARASRCWRPGWPRRCCTTPSLAEAQPAKSKASPLPARMASASVA